MRLLGNSVQMLTSKCLCKNNSTHKKIGKAWHFKIHLSTSIHVCDGYNNSIDWPSMLQFSVQLSTHFLLFEWHELARNLQTHAGIVQIATYDRFEWASWFQCRCVFLCFDRWGFCQSQKQCNRGNFWRWAQAPATLCFPHIWRQMQFWSRFYRQISFNDFKFHLLQPLLLKCQNEIFSSLIEILATWPGKKCKVEYDQNICECIQYDRLIVLFSKSHYG